MNLIDIVSQIVKDVVAKTNKVKVLSNNMKAYIFIILFLNIAQLCASSRYSVNSSGVYLGVRASRMDWQDNNTPYLDYQIGPSAGLDYRKPNQPYGGYRFFWNFGSFRREDLSFKFRNMDLQGRFGVTYGQTFLLTPYTGIGVTIANFQKKHTREICREQTYHAIYVPVGALMTYHPSSTTSIGVDYQYMPQIDSYLKIKSFKGVAFELKERGQHSIEIPIQFCYPKPRFRNIQYRIIPFYRTYAYGASKILCSCDCQDNQIAFEEQNVHEWGLRYEVAIW